jgi:putative glutathione S-transferase
LVRFDPIFYSLFKLNKKRLADYNNINIWMNNLLTIPAFHDTLNIESAKYGYYNSDHHKSDKITKFGECNKEK